MKIINTMIIAVAALSLLLVAGCYENGTVYPIVDGYDKLVEKGWVAFEAGDYTQAMSNFQSALEADVSKPDAYLGAAWTTVLVSDYWVVGDQYDYMAVQLDGGTWPLESFTEKRTQDKDWTMFQCTYPELTDNDKKVISSFGDELLVIEGDTIIPAFTVESGDTTWYLTVTNLQIGQWLYDAYGKIRFQYKFEIENPDVNSIMYAENGQSQLNCSMDSIVNGSSVTTVYISVPPRYMEVGDDREFVWCMNQNPMTFDYATYKDAEGKTSISDDAVAAFGILQDVRGKNGDILLGISSLLALADGDEYTFSHFSGVTSLKMRGMAAAMAYRERNFRPALNICQNAGFALDIEPSDSDFLVRLMQEIEQMLL